MTGGSHFFTRASPPSDHINASPPSTPPHHHHTFSEAMMDDIIDDAEALVAKFDIDAHKHQKFSSLFVDDRTEAKRFLEAVTGLQSAMHYHVKISSSSAKIIKAQNLMQIAIKRLEKEFYVMLSANRKKLDSESVSSRSSRASITSAISDLYIEDEVSEDGYSTTPSRTPPQTPPREGDSVSEEDKALDSTMADLKSIADCMIRSGYAKECVNIYKVIRKSIIDETLYALGVEKLNHSQMQKMDWNVLEAKLRNWIHAFRIAVKKLFYGERILCDVVFSSSEKIAESCFTEISKDAALNLFSFPENFGKSKKLHSPEKIFRALDLYEAISDLWPEIESIFSYESLTGVRSEAVTALTKLAEAVRFMLNQFESAIQKDSSKSTTGGGVHPLTRYVMNFLIFLADYSGAVSDIVSDFEATAKTPLPESYFSSPTSGIGEDTAITARFAWLILVLLCKLDSKAALYSDVALSYLFLANNLNYVVSKVRNSNLGLLMGPEWIWKNRSKVNKFIANYERMGWSKAVTSLPEDPTAEISPDQVRECFRRFNMGFEEAYKRQGSWVIPDPKLRDEVKISLAKMVVPPYRVFYQKHRAELVSESIVRYAPEDLDNYLSDLFFATSGGTSKSSAYETPGRR